MARPLMQAVPGRCTQHKEMRCDSNYIAERAERSTPI